MISTAFSDKPSAREYFLSERRKINPDVLEKKSLALCRSLFLTEEFKKADVLLLYFPIKNEINVLPIAERALSLGRRIAFPIADTRSHTLDFRFVDTLGELREGAYKIAEPQESAPVACFSKNTVCILPALAFDTKGYRLGYGKGFYDRFLADFCGTSVGLVMDGFLCSSLPTNNTDVAADIIITETGVIRVK